MFGFLVNSVCIKWTPLYCILDSRGQTGPSSGVVSSILLVSPGVSLAEVCATCLRCHLW